MKITESHISFKVGKKKHEFKVYNDLPETFGLNIECALDNWLARTDDYSSESLCDYVTSKNTGHFCITEKQYKRIKLSMP